MKEITRIHIAKTPYDIEVAAKKALEAYLSSLGAYADDKEIINDVEIRITEILESRGVKKNGVVTGDDVVALKDQLGEPRDFMDEDEMVVAPEDEEKVTTEASRKLFRDTDHAVFGGVLAGVAAFFKISPVWVRLVFIILALASFGTALLVYLVLWIAVPPARTAADRLQMTGQPVTVKSIRELNETSPSKSGDDKVARRVITILLGIASVFAALGAAAVTIFALLAVIFGGFHYLVEPGTGSRYFMIAFALAVASGVLLTVLFTLTAYASFAQRLTRRVLISICVVIVSGFLTFGGAIGVMQYGGLQRNYFVEANTHTSTVALPDNTKDISSLVLDSHGVQVKYFATAGKPYAQLTAVAKDQSMMPTADVSVQGKALYVTTNQSENDTCLRLWICNDTRPTLEIHGPQLEAVNAKQDSMIDYQTSIQPKLEIVAGENVSVNMLPGNIDTVTVDEAERSVVSLTQATVNHVKADIKSASNLEAGTVQTLEVADPRACPSHTPEARVSVWNVTSGDMMLGGAKRAAATTDTGCIEIDIEGEEA